MAYIDPRGPIRSVVSSYRDWSDGGAVLVTLDCGHSYKQAAHFSEPKSGEDKHCLDCRNEDYGNQE